MATNILEQWDVTSRDEALSQALTSAAQNHKDGFVAIIVSMPNGSWFQGQRKKINDLFRQAMNVVPNPDVDVVRERLFGPIKAAYRQRELSSTHIDAYLGGLKNNLDAVANNRMQIKCESYFLG